MADWNETTLRGAASWKAFKEGKSLFENGAVTAAKKGDDSWSGTVRDGKRLLKAAVKVISATNLEARCGCPDNQSTGALCAHAVAAGLAALGQSSAGPAARAAQPAAALAPPTGPAAPLAYSISLPLNWLEALKRGKLSLTLTTGGEITPADERLGVWLASIGAKPAFPLQLNLDDARCGSLLNVIARHPRVKIGKTSDPVVVESGGLVPVAPPERNGDWVEIHTDEQLTQISGAWFKLSPAEILRMGPGPSAGPVDDLLLRLAQTKSARFPLKDFLENIGRWQEWLEIPPTAWLDAIHFVPAKPSFQMEIDGSLQRLEARIRVRYGDSISVPLGRDGIREFPRLEGDCCEIRNWEEERRVRDWLIAKGFETADSSGWVMPRENSVVGFLANDLAVLQDTWTVIESDRFKVTKRQVIRIEPRIEILGSGEDWMSFNFSFQSNDGRSFPADEIRRLLASNPSYGGKRVVIDSTASNVIEPLFGELDLRQEGGHFVAAKAASEVIREIRNKIVRPPNNQLVADNHETFDFSLIQANLRPYQTYGTTWLLDRVNKYGGALLADDMGLGKTLQTIACIDRLMSAAPGLVLIIATASLLGNWKAEFAKFAPHLRVRILHGSGRESGRENLAPGDILLTTFGTLPRDLAWYLKQLFRAVIVDEASLMRNPDTDHAKAIARLNAEARIALTGTPIENGVRDLWSIFRFIQPGWLGGREEFRQRYETAGDDRGVIERLRLKTSPFMLRRTKDEVAPELPSKIFIEEFCDLTPDQQAVYRQLLVEGRKRVEDMEDARNQGAARMRMLTALLRLRQTCCDLALLGNDRFKQFPITKRSSKLQRLLELLGEAISGGHKILVFSQFQKQLQEIEKCLNEGEIPSLRLDGQTRNRQELVDRFQSADGPPVFLISLKAGGYGLNLTAADVVIHFDPWWNPAAEAQATDRAHRIGQSRPVTVYRLVARGTVEEKVVHLQNRKKRIAGVIDDSGAGDAAGWSDEELVNLLEG